MSKYHVSSLSLTHVKEKQNNSLQITVIQ